MPEGLVEAIAVCRTYSRGIDSFSALAPTTCRILAGDRIALVGPSGSGKSTFLNLMGGFDRPSAGRISWPALGPLEKLRPGKVAFVFQMPSLLPALSVVENVELPMLLGHARDDCHEAALTALDLFGLRDLAEKLPDQLSGGQAQRVAIARAVVIEPRLLLADEPTSQLDHTTASQVLDTILAHFAGSVTAIVMATHDISVANRMKRRWWMDHGVLRPEPLSAIGA